MASRGMSEFRANGTDYTVNDPNIANEFSAASAYSIGDYCYYQGNLYRFKANHSVGDWSSSDVDQVKIGEKIKLEETLRKYNDDIICGQLAFTFNTATAYTKGQYVVYNSELYRFTSNHAAGAWNSSDVIHVTTGGEFQNAHESLDDIRSKGVFKYPKLTDSDDLDDITEAGVYCYASSSVPDNAPLEVGSVLCVFQTADEIAQVVYTLLGSSYIRYRGSSLTWTATWQRNGENTVTPDDFTGTDSDKLQAALDSLASTGGTILLTREYTLTKNVKNSLDTNYNRKITLRGIGKEAKISFGVYSITGSIPDRTGGLWFDNVVLQGSGTAFDCSCLIRMYFKNCYFIGFTDVFYAGNERSGSKIFQSIYVDQCTFRNIMGAVFDNAYNAIFDVHFTNSIVEASRNFFVCTGHDYIAGIYVSNNCIEGLLGSIFVASPNQAIDQCVFTSNYFEQNAAYFDLTQMLFPANMIISDNLVAESQNVPFVDLPSWVVMSNGTLTVERNTLTDRTSPCHVFGFPNNAESGNYKGIVYGQNRFDYLTSGNEYNDVLPFNGTRQLEFTGTDFSDFVETALAYLAVAQNKPSETYSIKRPLGDDEYEYYDFVVNQYASGVVNAFIFNGDIAVIVKYTNGGTTIKTLAFEEDNN